MEKWRRRIFDVVSFVAFTDAMSTPLGPSAQEPPVSASVSDFLLFGSTGTDEELIHSIRWLNAIFPG